MPHSIHRRVGFGNNAPTSLFFSRVLAALMQLLQASPAWLMSPGSQPAGPPCSLADGEAVFVGTTTSATEDRTRVRRVGRDASVPVHRQRGIYRRHGHSRRGAIGYDVVRGMISTGQADPVAGGRGPGGTARVSVCSYTSRRDDARNEIEISASPALGREVGSASTAK